MSWLINKLSTIFSFILRNDSLKIEDKGQYHLAKETIDIVIEDQFSVKHDKPTIEIVI